MKRYRLLLHVSLSILAGALVGHPAIAQGYGPKPRIISVSSTGSGMNPEAIADGQTQTSLDHRGPGLLVQVWIPNSYEGYWHAAYARLDGSRSIVMARLGTRIVYESGKAIGTIRHYSNYGSFNNAQCNHEFGIPVGFSYYYVHQQLDLR